MPKRADPVGASVRRLVSAKDLRVLAKRPPATLAAWCLPERYWFDLCWRVASRRSDGLDMLAQHGGTWP